MSGRTESPYTEHQFRFMRRALALAGKGRFSVWPNPRVGCVITQPGTSAEADSRIIGEGYHSKKGEPHAERMALASCAESPRGGTLYVTLEPCCHHGATPPCTDAILEAGIQQVFVAIRDPFPQVNGKGVEILRKQGIQVDVGLLEEEAWYENRFFFHRHQQGTPWVLLKTAITLDGKCATASGHSKWITSEAARAHVHKIRGEMDAIAIGIGTLKADDSLLTARIPEAETALFVPPARVVLDPFLDLPLRSKMLASVEQAPVWVFCAKTAPNANQKQIESAGANVSPVSGTGPRLDLMEILAILGREKIGGVMIEGGPLLHTAFLEHGLVNEVFAYIAPILAGGQASPTFYMGEGVATMNEAFRLQRVQRTEFGSDTLIQGVLKR